MFKRFKDWLIHKLGGYTEDEYADIVNRYDLWKNLCRDNEEYLRIARERIAYHEGRYNKLRSQIKSAESHIAIDARYGYTEDNVIEASKAQTMFNLGKAVYPYAEHFITGDGVYLASVGVVDWEDEE